MKSILIFSLHVGHIINFGFVFEFGNTNGSFDLDISTIILSDFVVSAKVNSLFNNCPSEIKTRELKSNSDLVENLEAIDDNFS